MKILYISTSFPKAQESSTIYTDLAEELTNQNHQVTVVVSEEKKKTNETSISIERGMKVLRVVTGNLYDVGILEKGITIFLMQYQMKKAIKDHLNHKEYDLILFESPPVTIASIVKWAMKYYDCPSYLMLKDIFPQNALDIGILSKKHPAYYYFKSKERDLYSTASVIGVMSEANKAYLLKQNKDISSDKIRIFPNTKKINEHFETPALNFRDKYHIPLSAKLAVYGGNMGKPQGIDFLCEILGSHKSSTDIFFLLVGRGTEKEKINDYISKKDLKNVLLLDSLPRDEYESMLLEADIGLVFLDKRFTIPNFPSRVLSYFEKQLPVLAAIDQNTDFGDMIINSKSGKTALAGDLNDFNNKLSYMINNPKDLKKMGLNGSRYMKENYNVKKSVDLIEDHISSIT
ncbi:MULTISPECIES: glycosyltransferase family 4 protein [Planococcaceae]|uniref:Glycosyltransferase WbuB n=1 Tax=Planococcus halotolerans TaxID=2233542 RepID=A0A365L5N0_9BACL|nr:MULTISPECIES: glycosyltransferase family 4 protein [Planococcaceae]RAZ80722.1 glycosyltransferase WbuB [Planococcus halotolerans]RLQ86719.1 glycosyltransferase WbuB [Planomicrobium sp. Y74]